MHKLMKHVLIPAIATTLLVPAVLSTQSASAADYGDISGQFILKGDAPDLKPLVTKGQFAKPGLAPCSVNPVPSEDLVVDEKTKGIANVFIFLRKKPKKIHPDLKSTPDDKKEVVVDQVGCQYVPHALLLRSDQVVVVKSADKIAHNVHTGTIKNKQENFIIPGIDREGKNKIKFRTGESIPLPTKCDIHSWMKSQWLILDHPYAALTDKEGKFKIEKLPVGKYTFRVWQESAGWIDKKFKVDVKKGDNELDVVEVDVKKFKFKD